MQLWSLTDFSPEKHNNAAADSYRGLFSPEKNYVNAAVPILTADNSHPRRSMPIQTVASYREHFSPEKKYVNEAGGHFSPEKKYVSVNCGLLPRTLLTREEACQCRFLFAFRRTFLADYSGWTRNNVS
jgi:hypothetical protein